MLIGSALIVDVVLEPTELAHLPYGRTSEDHVRKGALLSRGVRLVANANALLGGDRLWNTHA